MLYRVSVAWWLYALFLVLGVHVIATVIYASVHGGVVPIRPLELSRQWWLFYMFVFGLFQGPLSEELGWRGFLLPRLLNNYSPLQASVILGLMGAAWHINVFFSSISTVAMFTASIVAASILTTVMFLHTRGSVLPAIVMHWSIMPGKDIARISFPAAQEPPDWLRAVVGIAVALTVLSQHAGSFPYQVGDSWYNIATALNDHRSKRVNIETELNAANFTAAKPKMLVQFSVHSLNRAIRFKIHVENFFDMVRLGWMQILLRHL